MKNSFHGELRYISTSHEHVIATLDEVKLALRIDHDADNAYVRDDIIPNAKAWIEEYISRKLDDCAYDIVFDFRKRTPNEYDKLWLGAAPVAGVQFEGQSASFAVHSTPNGFDKYVEYNSSIFGTPDRLTLRLTTSCEVWIARAVKVPFYTVCSEMYRYREFTIRPGAVNNVIAAALKSYKREI